MKTVPNAILGMLLLVTLALGISGALALQANRDLARAHDRVQRTNLVLARIEGIHTGLMDAETGHRGFLITGDESYLDSVRQAEAELPVQEAALRDLLREDGTQSALLEELHPLLESLQAEFRAGEELRRGPDFRPSSLLPGVSRGRRLTGQAEGILAGLAGAERRKLAGQVDQSSEESRVASRTHLGLLASSLLALGLAFLAIFRSFREEARAKAALQSGARETTVELLETYHTLVSTLECMTDGFVSLDRDGRFTYVNRRAEELLGKSAQDLLGGSAWELFPKLAGKPFQLLCQRASAERTPLAYETRRQDPDRWFENRIYPNPDGGVAIFTVETTERKRAEAALQRSEKRFRSLVLATSQLVWTRDPEGKASGDDPTWPVPIGRFLDGILESRGLPEILPSDWPRMEEAWERANHGDNGLFEVESGQETHGGPRRYLLVRGVPIQDEDGKILEWVGTCTDITEKKQSDAILSKQNQILKMLAEGATLDEILSALARFVQGMSERTLCSVALLDAEGRRLERCVAPDLPEAFRRSLEGLAIGPGAGACGPAILRREAVLARDLATDPAWEHLQDLVLPLGIRACSSWPILGAGGQPLGAFSMYYREPALPNLIEVRLVEVCTDLAGIAIERRRADEELQRLNADLEHRVALRTAELQAAVKDIESFSYSVSHDLRAPLRAIAGFAEIVADRHSGTLNEEGRRYMGNILLASARMGELIDDLLAYARLGRGAFPLQPLLPGETIRAALATLSDRIQATAAEIDVAEPLPKVLGHPTLLRQIFANLLENSLKYRRPDVPPRIRVEARIVENGIAEFRVQDNGAGVPEEYLEVVFQVFQRLHSPDTHPGTGVGLAIVRKSAELMGGQVWIEPGAETGCTFVLRLPAA